MLFWSWLRRSHSVIHIRRELRKWWDFQQLFSAVCDPVQPKPDRLALVWAWKEEKRVNVSRMSSWKGLLCVFWVKIVTGFGSSCDVLLADVSLGCVWFTPGFELRQSRERLLSDLLSWFLTPAHPTVYYAPPSCSQTRWKKLHLLWEQKAQINDWEKWRSLKGSGALRGNKIRKSRVKEFR